jgi:hypothetical protein
VDAVAPNDVFVMPKASASATEKIFLILSLDVKPEGSVPV